MCCVLGTCICIALTCDVFDLTALGFMVGFGGGGGGHDSVHFRVTFLSEGTTTCLCSFGFMFFWVRCALCLGDVHMYCVHMYCVVVFPSTLFPVFPLFC